MAKNKKQRRSMPESEPPAAQNAEISKKDQRSQNEPERSKPAGAPEHRERGQYGAGYQGSDDQ